MDQNSPTRIGFLGSGHIASAYAASIARHSELKMIGVFDLDQQKAEAFAGEHRCKSFESMASLAGAVDIVVNLTSAPHHYSTTRDLISLGTPIFSEKPIALGFDQAQELVSLAEEARVPLASAPSLWLGRSHLEAAARIHNGEIGTVRLVTAEVHQGHIERWHSAPHSFYQVGPVVDAGVYPLTYLTAVLGPIRQVSATSMRLLPSRTTKGGENFEIGVEDAWYVIAIFESGAALRLSCDYYIASATVPRSIELHGDAGSLRIDDWVDPNAVIERADFGCAYEAEPSGPGLELDWSLGLLDFARSMLAGVRHRNAAQHAAHVVEVLHAIATSATRGKVVAVSSTFPSPFGSSNLLSKES